MGNSNGLFDLKSGPRLNCPFTSNPIWYEHFVEGETDIWHLPLLWFGRRRRHRHRHRLRRRRWTTRYFGVQFGCWFVSLLNCCLMAIRSLFSPNAAMEMQIMEIYIGIQCCTSNNKTNYKINQQKTRTHFTLISNKGNLLAKWKSLKGCRAVESMNNAKRIQMTFAWPFDFGYFYQLNSRLIFHFLTCKMCVNAIKSDFDSALIQTINNYHESPLCVYISFTRTTTHKHAGWNRIDSTRLYSTELIANMYNYCYHNLLFFCVFRLF